ncbi:hypothetical protein DWX98_00580 [Blautia sp. AF22-5LB]|nr:hypothetical protein DWX98_00580 [Blautia sp. AF22-5LB]
MLSYSQFKGQAHRAKTKVPVGSTSDKLKKISKPDSRAGEGYHKQSGSTAEIFAGAGGLNMGSL